MGIKRVRDPQVIKYLSPFFTEDGDYTRDVIAAEFFNIMVSTPDEIFVVVIFEGSELHGFGISYLPDNREYIWLAQAWSKPGSDRNYGKAAIDMIKQWAIGKHNIHEIRFETGRNPKAIKRAWGFSTHAFIMRDKF